MKNLPFRRNNSIELNKFAVGGGLAHSGAWGKLWAAQGEEEVLPTHQALEYTGVEDALDSFNKIN